MRQSDSDASIKNDDAHCWFEIWIENNVRASADPNDDFPAVEVAEWKKACLQAAAEEGYTASDLSSSTGGEDEFILMLHKAVCSDWEAQLKRATRRD